MPTGSKTLLLNSKQLLGFQDLGLRGFTALRNSHIEATQARWDVDGAFNTKLVLASSGANNVQVLGSSKSTDGLGHVLNIASAYRNDAQFQNTAGVTYYVGLMYAEVPAGIRVNPLTGKPQFDSYVEEVGIQAAPNSVVDNGNGTITMVIDSALEASVSSAGRTVRVWKVVPADGGNTFSIALEETTSVFAGGLNKITTVGKFGQTTISTTASDYLVTVMGPRVARNTDLSAISGVAFVGTVLGNGTTPIVFDNTDQTLLKTFQDASQIAYTPAGWLSPGATTVQLALDTIISGLGNTVATATSGASKIGVYAPDYNTVAAGGIGNVADSTYTAAATVSSILLGIDAMARRRQTHRTIGDGGAGTQVSDFNSVNLTTGVGTDRPQWLRKLQTPASAPYQIPSDVPIGAGQGSYFIGEESDPTQSNLHLRKSRVTVGSVSNRALSFGKWQRVWLDAEAGATFRFGGSSQRYSQILEDFGANGGGIRFDMNATPTEKDTALNWRNGVVVPKDEASKANPASLYFGNSGSGWIWAVLEKLLVYGNSPTQTGTKYGALHFTFNVDATYLASTVATQGRPIVIRDCVFVTQDTAQLGLIRIEGTQHITFENCRFFDIAGRSTTDPTIGIFNASAQVTFKNCVVFSPEGCGVGSGTNFFGGVFENCSFICGLGGTSACATPSAFNIVSDQKYGIAVRDCRIFLGTSMFRATGGGATPLISIGGMMYTVSGLNVKVDSTQTHLGFARVLEATTTGNNPGQGAHAIIDGLTIDLAGAPHHDSAAQGPIRFSGFASAGNNSSRLTVNNLLVRNTQINAAAVHTDNPLIQCDTLVNGSNWLLCASNTAPTRTIAALVKLAGDNNTLKDMRFSKAIYAANMAAANGTFWAVGNNNVIDGITADQTVGQSGTGSAPLVQIAGNDNRLRNVDVTQGSDTSIVANIIGRDNEVTGCLTRSTANTGSPFNFPAGSTWRRNKFLGNSVHWNGTSLPAVNMASFDSLVDQNTFYRSDGAIVAISNGAAGSVTGGSNITSTVL